MPRPRQGEIWWANLPSPAGRRPVVVLTRDAAIARLNSLTVAPLTRSIRNVETEVILTEEQGVMTLCAISLDNILTIPKNQMDLRLTALSRDSMNEVFAAIRTAFDMP